MENAFNKDLLNRLSQKYLSKDLAHFYIINGNLEDPTLLKNWIHDFISTCVAQTFHCEKDNAQRRIELGLDDLFWPELNKNGTWGQELLNDLEKFIKYRPLEMNYRLAIIQEAQEIGQGLSNKLLKTLESPPDRTVIIFLNSNGKALLPTIESRAIKLQLQKEMSHTEFEHPWKSVNPADVHNYESAQEILNTLKLYAKAEAYNNQAKIREILLEKSIMP